MKAWIVSIKGGYDQGEEIVFANNRTEAKQLCSLDDNGNYILIQAKRCREYDNMESYSKAELAWEQHKNGWEWFDYSVLNNDKLSKNEFIRIYNSIFNNHNK